MDRESIEKLSNKQRVQKFGSMDHRSCRESIEKKPKNLDGSRFRQGVSRKGERMARYKGIYREVVNPKERRLFKEGKNT